MYDQRQCEWNDLDANTGVCVNCGEAFYAEDDPTLAIERHYDQKEAE